METFDFTFKTTDEYLSARKRGYIENYNMVRISVFEDKYAIDFPVHSEEEFNSTKEYLKLKNIPYKVYSDVHAYDVQDYI